MARRIVGEAGPWLFFEHPEHKFSGDLAGKPLYSFERDGERGANGELYLSLDEAMVAAVGEKHTGARGAGGTAVGTAADWFMAMIGASRRRISAADLDRMVEAFDTSWHEVDKLSARGLGDRRRAGLRAALREIGIEVMP